MAASLCIKAPHAIAAPVTPTRMSACKPGFLYLLCHHVLPNTTCLARCHCTAGWRRSKWATSTLTRTSPNRGCSHPCSKANSVDSKLFKLPSLSFEPIQHLFHIRNPSACASEHLSYSHLFSLSLSLSLADDREIAFILTKNVDKTCLE